MEQRLRNAIAKIEVIHGGEVTSRGTGTLVADGLVLTALHVVGDRKSDPVQFLPGDIRLTFPGHVTAATPVERRCHAGLDWALLRCAEPPAARPVPLGEIRESGMGWTTYGFPDAQPIDGMVQAGTVRNADARIFGQQAYQLFSEEASAGRGAPVRGLSGGPVLVDGALVGVLRYALMNEGQAVAGTLYACPALLAVEACEGELPIPDPCHGLPGLPRRPLPEEPYRFLSRYREEDAEIFFGRNQDIRAVYEQVTSEDGVGVVLFYGQTGVGKSSFLDAGLVPRLRWTHDVQYLRRDAAVTLLATVRGGLASRLTGDAGDGADSLGALWRRAESECGRPIVLILDQVEEVYTRRVEGRADELSELGRALHDVFHGELAPPRGQIVLGFRKEWYPEVQQRLEDSGVDFSRVFLETLDKDGVVEAVNGLTVTRRLRERYGLTVEPELPPVLAGQLHEDPDSPIAPTLQILLAKMWKTARAQSAHAPAFTLDLYTRLKHEGALLADFLDQQIAAMSTRRPSAVASGLVLDVLARHTTPLLTADECSVAALNADYAHHREFDGLLVDMQELYLLVDAGQDAAGEGHRSRLAHDTLAPHVRQRYDDSAHPGQAASRILQARVPAGAAEDSVAPLDDHDLRTVENGIPGMRALRPIEQSLVDASRVDRDRRRRAKVRVRNGFFALLCVLSLALVIATNEFRAAKQQAHFTDLSNTTDKVRSDLVSSPSNGLGLAFWAVCSSLDSGFPVANELKMSLSTAVEQARETDSWTMSAPINGLSTHPSEPQYAVALENGFVQMWTRCNLLIGRPLACFDDPSDPLERVDGHSARAARCVAHSPDGRRLYAGGNDGRLRAWQPGVPGAPVAVAEHGAPIRCLAVSSDGRYVATGGNDGEIRIWNADVSPTGIALHAPESAGTTTHRGGVNALAWTPEGLLAAGGDGGVLRLWDVTVPEKPVAEVACHKGPILAVAAVASRALGTLIATGGADETVRVFHGDGRPVTTRNWLPGSEEEHAAGESQRNVVIADHSSAVRAVAFDRVGAYLLSGDEMGVVLLNDARGEPGARPFLGPSAAVRSISYFPDGVSLIGGLDHRVRMRSPHGLMVGSDLRPLGESISFDDPELSCVAFSSDGELVAAGDLMGWVTVWDQESLQLLRRFPGENGAKPVGVTFVAAAPIDGKTDEDRSEDVAVAYDDGTLRVFGETGASRLVLGPGARITSLAGHHAENARDGRIAIGDAEGVVRVVDLHADDVVETIHSSSDPVTAVAMSADGLRLAFAYTSTFPDGDQQSMLSRWEHRNAWSEVTKAVSPKAGRSHGLVHGLAIGAKGQVLYSAGEDGKLRVRKFDDLETVYPAQKAHLGAALAVAANSDGTRVVTGGSDGRVVLWGVRLVGTGGLDVLGLLTRSEPEASVNRIAEFVPAHRWPVVAVAFGGPDESLAVSASRDGSARLWSARYEAWLELAKERMEQGDWATPPDPRNEYETEVYGFLRSPPWRHDDGAR